MNEHKRIFALIAIMTGVSLVVGGITITLLYRAALDESREQLVETAQSQARLIEAVARFDRRRNEDYPEGWASATLSQITDAHQRYKGFGETGEFTLARRDGDDIVFLLSHRHADLESPKPVPFDSELAEPMRRALLGQSGTVIGLDYRGSIVVAAHEPVAELELGIVAKIDLAEVRAPFIKAGLFAAGSALFVILFGSALFIRISSPILRRLHALYEKSQQELADRKLAEAALQRERDNLLGVLEAMEDGVYIVDRQYDIQYGNPALEKDFGLHRNRKCYEYFHDRQEVCPWCKNQQVFDGNTVRWEWNSSRTGKVYDLIDTALKNPDGSISKLEILRDITQRKRAEAVLQESHDDLERRVEQRTEDLAEANAALNEEIAVRRQAEQRLESEGELLRRLLDLQERERKLLSHEIHDGFVQDVVGGKMTLEGVLAELESQDWPGTDRIQPGFDLLARAIAEGRRMISELRPMIIDDAGVVEALTHLVAEDCSDPSLRVELSFSAGFDRLDPMLEGAIYRIVQEALTNVKRHSQSGTAAVELTREGHRLLLKIRDEGVGFDPNRVSNERFGLRGIRERARLFGGHATIDSTPGDGTRITVDLPLEQEAPGEAEAETP
jgi:signal transduction histidine kinase